MKFFAGAAILVIALASGVSAFAGSSEHYYTYKSFVEAEQECAVHLQVAEDNLQRYRHEGYPDEPEVRCLVLCVLENLRAYQNSTGLKEHVLANFFVPAAEDCDNAKRTEKCLFYLPQECNGDRCTAAYKAFQCYYQNYGTLTHCPQFIVNYFDEDFQQTCDLFNMLDVSQETRRKLAGACFPSGPESECFFRAYQIRSDLYSDSKGPHLRNLYTQFHEEAFKEGNAATLSCLENVKKLACNKSKCEQATEVWVKCFSHTKAYAHFVNVFKYGANHC
ncbi:uncharacterized protein LOC118459961 [Anopheles albimanus]|uniref:uncharacterized protein LOC118459952 n=1 Tax=Anopheles albimanus TaxID=7167 RepID=UPI001641F628|nr:uncharacterized protein LOC118459952 [Anopheles albimanus]XP_035779746.1 uncharacterized protein LOC118459961 [Anopheles albimanus]